MPSLDALKLPTTFLHSFILSTSSCDLTLQRKFLCNNLVFNHSPSRHSLLPQLYRDCSPILSGSGGSFSFYTLFYPSAEFNGMVLLSLKNFIPTITPLCLDFPFVHYFSFYFLAPLLLLSVQGDICYSIIWQLHLGTSPIISWSLETDTLCLNPRLSTY